jgi:phosphate transport system protein
MSEMAEQQFYRQHISGQFNAELDAVKAHLLEMGGAVEKQVISAVDALLARDSGDAQLVIERDQSINQTEVTIDDECFRILARRQPAAGDLRLVLAIGKAVADLERIGDEAGRIARQAITFSEQSAANFAQPAIQRVTNNVTARLHGALDAFARGDAKAALGIARGDEEVDEEIDSVMATLAEAMRHNPEGVDTSIMVMWVLRSLERVGDHARNIAEHVIYMVEGVDVRHAELDTVLEWLPDH